MAVLLTHGLTFVTPSRSLAPLCDPARKVACSLSCHLWFSTCGAAYLHQPLRLPQPVVATLMCGRWAESHRDALERRGSALEFQLHRLAYMTLVCSGKVGWFNVCACMTVGSGARLLSTPAPHCAASAPDSTLVPSNTGFQTMLIIVRGAAADGGAAVLEPHRGLAVHRAGTGPVAVGPSINSQHISRNEYSEEAAAQLQQEVCVLGGVARDDALELWSTLAHIPTHLTNNSVSVGCAAVPRLLKAVTLLQTARSDPDCFAKAAELPVMLF